MPTYSLQVGVPPADDQQPEGGLAGLCGRQLQWTMAAVARRMALCAWSTFKVSRWEYILCQAGVWRMPSAGDSGKSSV